MKQRVDGTAEPIGTESRSTWVPSSHRSPGMRERLLVGPHRWPKRSAKALLMERNRAVPTCHCANTLALVKAPPIVLAPPNTVLRTGAGDR